MPVRKRIATRLVFVAVGSIALSSTGCRTMSAFPGMSWLDNDDDGSRYAYAENPPEVEYQPLPSPGSTAEPYSVGGSTAANDVSPVGLESQTYPATSTPYGPEAGRQSGYADNSFPPDPAGNPRVDQGGSVAGNSQQGFYRPEYQPPVATNPLGNGSTYSPPVAGVDRTATGPNNTTPQYDGMHQGTSPAGSLPQGGGSQYNGSQYNGNQYNGSQYNGSQYNGSQYNGSQYNGGQQGVSVPPGNLAPATPIQETSGGYTPVTPAPAYNSNYQAPPANPAFPTTNSNPVSPTAPGYRQPESNFRPAGTSNYGGLDSVEPSSIHQGTHPSSPVIPANFESNLPSGESWEASPAPTRPVAEPSVYQTGETPTPFGEFESLLSLASSAG